MLGANLVLPRDFIEKLLAKYEKVIVDPKYAYVRESVKTLEKLLNTEEYICFY